MNQSWRQTQAVVSTPPQERIDYATYKLTIVGKEWILDLCDFSSTSVLHSVENWVSYLSVESDEVCVFFLFFVQFNVSHLSLFISDMNRIPNTILQLQTQAGRCLSSGRLLRLRG